jgi:protein arginine N-methyltransferase 2
VQVELQSLSLQTKFEQLRVAELGDEVWQGVRNRYWHFPVYFLPVVSPMDKTIAAAEADAEVPGAAAGPRDHDDQAAAVSA